VPANNEAVVVRYHELIQEQVAPAVTASLSSSSVRLAEEQPLVTVAVTYFNLPAYLPEALESLAAQTYANLEVLVVDDGSTSPVAIRVFEEQRSLYPQFRFLSQPNGGLSAARNLALAEAGGEYFLPVDADNIARPDMVAVFVRGLRRNPELSALACFYLAFETDADRQSGKCLYAYRPTGGPHVMASFRNVYGDANSIFRTADLRTINGYEPDRDSTCEDWEAFVKLINAGFRLDVLPEHLFFYRYRPDSMLRNTSPYRNQRRVLRHYFKMDELPKGERVGLWSVLHGMADGAPRMSGENSLCYQAADRLNAALKKLPWLHYLFKKAIVKFFIGRNASA
jgi:glycosyltransferase involved in cell wall biosynthesis